VKSVLFPSGTCFSVPLPRDPQQVGGFFFGSGFFFFFFLGGLGPRRAGSLQINLGCRFPYVYVDFPYEG